MQPSSCRSALPRGLRTRAGYSPLSQLIPLSIHVHCILLTLCFTCPHRSSPAWEGS